MPNGASGHQDGAHVVATVRREENQFQRSQEPGCVFQNHMEAEIAPTLKIKREGTWSYWTKKFGTAHICPVAPGLQHWDRGVIGLHVPKHAFLWVSQCLNE